MSSLPQAPVPSRSEKSLDDRVLAPDKERALDRQPCLIDELVDAFYRVLEAEGAPEAIAYLTRATKHPQAHVRLWALGMWREDVGVDLASGAVPDHIELLGDEVHAVRMKALSNLAWLGPEATEAVRRILEVVVNDRAESTREAAARALLAIDPEGVWVVPALRDSSERDRLVAELRLLFQDGRQLRRKVQAWQPVAAAREEEAAPGTGAEKEPAGTASDSGEAGRESRHKVEASQPVTATRPPVRAVTFSSGLNAYSLEPEGGGPVTVPANDWKEIIAIFVKAFLKGGCATEVRGWTILNAVVHGSAEVDVDKGSDSLRQTLKRFNDYLLDNLGPTPNGEAWLVARRGKGVQLNPSVKWSISDKLKQELSETSAWDHPTNPTILAEAQPNPGEKLPARSRGGQKRKDDDAVQDPADFNDD
jgi:hypothetical protein